MNERERNLISDAIATGFETYQSLDGGPLTIGSVIGPEEAVHFAGHMQDHVFNEIKGYLPPSGGSVLVELCDDGEAVEFEICWGDELLNIHCPFEATKIDLNGDGS